MYKRCYVLLFAVALSPGLLGCADSIVRSTVAPDWTMGQSAKYPDALYLTATGSAIDLERAKDRAMGNLSKIFEAHIIGSTTTSSDTQSKLSASGEKVSSAHRLVERINVQSEQVIEGIQIAEQWQNSADLTFYALAVIDREQVGAILKNDMKALDQASAFELSTIESQQDDLKRIAAYQRVIALQITRNKLQKMLKVIDLTGKGLPEVWNLVELKALSASAISAIKMSATVSVQNFSGLQHQLEAAMSNAGFSAVQDMADYTLLAEVNLQQPEEKQGWYWQRGMLEIRLIDAVSGLTRGSHSWELKASATQQSQLLNRIKQSIDKLLKDDLRNVLIEIAKAS